MADKLSIKIKNISVFSFAYNFALLGLFFGLVFGIFSVWIIKSLLKLTSSSSSAITSSSFDLVPFLVILISAPIIFAVLHFIIGLVLGLFVNLVFKISGGLKVNIEEDQILSKSSATAPLKVEYPPLVSSS